MYCVPQGLVSGPIDCSSCTLQTWSRWLKVMACRHTRRLRRRYSSLRFLPSCCSWWLFIKDLQMTCVGTVTSWVKSNMLSLNCDKTEVVWHASGRRQHQLLSNALSIDGTLVDPVKSARDLGIYMYTLIPIYRCGPVFNVPCFAVLRKLNRSACCVGLCLPGLHPLW